MKTKYIPSALSNADIKRLFVEMLGHDSFSFFGNETNDHFVAYSSDDAWDSFPNSAIAEIIVHPYANHWAFESILSHGGFWTTDDTGNTVWEECN